MLARCVLSDGNMVKNGHFLCIYTYVFDLTPYEAPQRSQYVRHYLCLRFFIIFNTPPIGLIDR
jgi:hypothetical protein